MYILEFDVLVQAEVDGDLIIQSDEELYPKYLEVTAPRDLVKYVNVYYVVGGESVKLHRQYIKWSQWASFEIPGWLKLGDDKQIVVNLECAGIAGNARVALLVEEWS